MEKADSLYERLSAFLAGSVSVLPLRRIFVEEGYFLAYFRCSSAA